MALKNFKIKSDAQMLGNITVDGYLAGPSNFVIDPASVGDDTGTVEIKGDLQVNGTTTTVNSTTLDVADLNITVAKGAANAGAADGAGLTVDGASATITYSSTGDQWVFNKAPFYNTNALLTDIVDDTTPQLGGNLDANGKNIIFDDSGSATDDRLLFGANSELQIYHDGPQDTNFIMSGTSTNMAFQSGGIIQVATSQSNLQLNSAIATLTGNDEVKLSGTTITTTTGTSGVVLDNNSITRLATTTSGVDITGTLNGHTIPGGTGTLALTSQLNSQSGTYDLDGNELIVDADGDTKIFASTDDELNLTVAPGGNIYFNFALNALKVYEFGSSGMYISTGPGSVWPKLYFKRNYSTTTPAAGDKLAQIHARGEDTAGNPKTYGQIEFAAESNAPASDRGSMELSLHRNNQLVPFYKADATSGIEQNIFYKDIKADTNVNLVFEGSSTNTNETTLTVVNPTTDRTIYLPNEDGTVHVYNGTITKLQTNHEFEVDENLGNPAVLFRPANSPSFAQNNVRLELMSYGNGGQNTGVPILNFWRNTGDGNSTAGDLTGQISFQGSDVAGNGYRAPLNWINSYIDEPDYINNDRRGHLEIVHQVTGSNGSIPDGGYTSAKFYYDKLEAPGNLEVGGQVISTIATGTAPMTVASTTVVSNLNADQLDGKHASDILLEATALAIALG